MAAGEYVSVHSQADTEQAELERERAELKADDKGEHKELTAIYVGRGLDPSLAKQVAEQLMAHDALGAHARDELGISETLQCASASGCVGIGWQLRCWSSHASLGHRPSPGGESDPSLSLELHCCSSRFWAGWLRARAARGVTVGAIRVTFWGALAMGLTAGVGACSEP